MSSLPAFLAVAAAVTLTPGPAFALLLQVAAVHGRSVALANIAGNSAGVLIWGALSAAGVSALVAASEVAYDVLRLGGAAFLIWLGVRALLASRRQTTGDPDTVSARDAGPAASATAWRAGRWYGSVAVLVDHFRQVARPRVLALLERLSGAVLLAFGVRLAAQTR